MKSSAFRKELIWRVAVFSSYLIAALLALPSFASEEAQGAAKHDKPAGQKSGQVEALKKKQNHVSEVVTKLSVKDPECQPFSPAKMNWQGFSADQRTAFEQAYKLARESNLPQAAKKYQELSRQTKSFEVLYNLGLIFAANAELTSAEQALKEAAVINPQNRETFKILSRVQKALGKVGESKYSMDRYLQL